MKEEILVSIWCIAYNHELYIRDAIESFLIQKVDFNYEIIIHDDASTDKTAEIIKEYEQKYPNLIYGIYEKENQYKQNISNMSWLLNMEYNVCRGKYIAICEGDDYWTDCHKLQLQVNYMETHPECILSLHNALKLNCQDGTMKTINPYDGDIEKDISAEEIIMQYHGHPPTASMFYRKKLIKMPDFFYKAPVGDYPRMLYGFLVGKVHYDSRIMSVYRWLSKESYNNRLTYNKEMKFYFAIGLVVFLDQYNKFTNYRYHVWLVNRIQRFALNAMAIVDLDMPFETYYEHCKKQGYCLAMECKNYFNRMEYLRKQIFDMQYCSVQVRNFVNNYENVIIMGKGMYGSIVAKQFKSNKLDFCGFAVSKKKIDENFFMEKPVWKLSEIPFKRENTGVVVALTPICWDDILSSLERSKIIHYICPFLF